MSKAITGYLNKRSVLEQHTLARDPGTGIEAVVVIPVLAESERLFLTLSDLALNPPAELARTLILCVVNNRAPEIAGEADCTDNQRTLSLLTRYTAEHPELRLAWIDAASPGHELAAKEGVGLARKIGLDWGLKVLYEEGHFHGPLISLDADTRVPANYLGAIREAFKSDTPWAAVVDYAHPIDGSGEETQAILAYELFLRYQEMASYGAGSPYAYPAIGSTMICTPNAYAAAGGMNRKQAGEDFYFLQQLAKTGRVDRIRTCTIAPASRGSHRVPFGTGRKVNAFVTDKNDAYLTYSPESYRVLAQWIQAAEAGLDQAGEVLLAQANAIETRLGDFLIEQNFVTAWNRIQTQCRDDKQRWRRFHEYFDAFRTLKLSHYLRDNGYPRVDLFEALAAIADQQHLSLDNPIGPHTRQDLDAQRALLQQLRDWRPN